ncbi:MAG: hypothetical protein Sv326_1236 [Candidatus Fermentimicrarchaeum limneticum]|uniref:Uncharacterized protein n=1 Tax=Fermentimicrarchaeum limneticum TaxID=2795018 RepID=A0A7D5XDK7_FERL1|nr:MAG: hypothetical protein Sv326_1236 [Candidatus Fermentimicrarchaeum limneticum]
MPVKRMSYEERLPMKNAIEAYALDCLNNPEIDVKQLYELLRRAGDKILATPKIIDRVGELMHDRDTYVRKLAVKVYVEMLKQNPELSSEERIGRFLELINDSNPQVKEIFLEKIGTPIKGLEEIRPDVRLRMFEMLCDPDERLRQAARKAVGVKFGISPEVSRGIADEVVKFSVMAQKRDAIRLIESLDEGLSRRGLDKNVVFEGVRKLLKETDQHEFADLKFTLHIAKNLLVGTGDAESYNECLRQSYQLYKEIKSRLKESGSTIEVGSSRWGSIVEKIFKDSIPELAEQMGYEHLALGLKDATEHVKKEEPERIGRSVMSILIYGKPDVI